MRTRLRLRSAIVEILNDKGGDMLDNDLMIALKSRYDRDSISQSEINRNLLILETLGIIHVSVLSKNKRRIRRILDTDTYMGVEED